MFSKSKYPLDKYKKESKAPPVEEKKERPQTTPFTVTKMETGHVFKNKVRLSATHQLENKQYLVEFKTRDNRETVYYPVDFSKFIPANQIQLTEPMREYLGYEEGYILPSITLTDLEKKEKPIRAYHLNVEILRVRPYSEVPELIDPAILARAFKDALTNYPVMVGQLLTIKHPLKENTFIYFLIKDVDDELAYHLKFNLAPSVYAINSNSTIHFSLSPHAEHKQHIKIVKTHQLRLDFVNKGIGGHKPELSQLVREAFYSRVLDPEVNKAYGTKHTKGILLYGPPGTGKTLIAREIGNLFFESEAKEGGAKKRNVTIIKGPELKNKLVGESQANLRQIFADAEAEWKRKGSESDLHIIIIDEIDALAPPRGSRGGGTGVDDDMVSTLLTILDGPEALDNILVIGTTNRKDLIDPAILRPGRISVHLEIGLPDQSARFEILTIHTKAMRENGLLDRSVDLAHWAKLTENYTGAELEELVKRSKHLAMGENFNPRSILLEVKKELKTIGQYAKVSETHFQKAFSEIIPAFGTNKENFKFDKNKFVIYNEMLTHQVHNFCESLAVLENKKGFKALRFLIAGDGGSGKTELAKFLATLSGAKYIKLLSPDSLSNFSLQQRLKQLDEEFTIAQKSATSVIILDDIEKLLEADYELSHPNNLLRIKIQTLLKKIDDVDNKIIVIATTCSQRFCINLFPHLFNETILLNNISINLKNKDDIIKFSKIAALFNITIIPPTAFLDSDTRVINLPIRELIYQMNKFCKGEKNKILNLDLFYKFLYERPCFPTEKIPSHFNRKHTLFSDSLPYPMTESKEHQLINPNEKRTISI